MLNIFSRFFSANRNDVNEPAEKETEAGSELVAVIAAALQEYMNTRPGIRLEVVSIKRTGQSVPVWSRAGRLERISGKL